MTPDLIQARNSAPQKSIAQRALDASYCASRLSEAVTAAYWLASCHEEQADHMAQSRIDEAEERLHSVATALGFKVERIGQAAIDQRDDEDGNDPVERSLDRSDRMCDATRNV
jgi:hypothetical protein